LFPIGYGLDYTSSSRLGPVNEDPKVDLAAYENSTTFFRRGQAPAPWYLATDGMVETRAVDLSAQEDARRFDWKGPGKFSVEGPPVSLATQAKAGASLVLDWRVDRRNTDSVKLALGGGTLDIAKLVNAAPLGAVIETRIPLRCFGEAGADLAVVGAPLRFDASAGFGATIRTVRVAEGAAEQACPAPAR